MHGFLKRSAALVLAIVLIASSGVYAAAEAVEKPDITPQEVQYTKNGDWISRENGFQATPATTEKSLVGAVALPAVYGSGDYIERVENQGSNGLCWAFVQNTLAAINVKKDEGKSVNYSETHMAYSLSEENGNPLGYSRVVNDGGNNEMSIAYMARGTGLVAEADDPYISTTLPYRSPAEIDGYFSTGYLEAAPHYYDCSVQKIKELIYEYGAAGVSIYYDTAFHNSNNLYYCPYTVTSNHGVTLVGWDDSRGFLAMNSWGASWGENGFFWISYNDKQVCSNVFATDYKSGELPYDGIRSYNNFGYMTYEGGENIASVSYGTTYDTGDARTLEGIGTYTVDANTKLEIYINPYDGDGKTASKFIKVHTQTFADPGYYHISFDAPVYLYGSKFNVKIKSSCAGGAYAPLETNCNYRDGTPYLKNAVFQSGRSYYGEDDGKMWLLEERYSLSSLEASGWNWSMQAFTNSDLAFEVDQAKVASGSEDYQVTLSQVSNGSYSITRNGADLLLYTNAACTARHIETALTPGTYYLKLQNGTHIRRTVVVTQSSLSPEGGANSISGALKIGNEFLVHLSGNTFAPTVSYIGSSWSLYALPGGIGKIGSTFTPSRFRTVIYLRVIGIDGIATYEYPVRVHTSYKSTNGYSDWNNVSNWAQDGMTRAVRYGVITGSGGMLNPKQNVTRAQAATMLLAAAGIESSKVSNAYAAVYGDVDLNAWYAKPVGVASMLGVVSGHQDPGYRAFSPVKAVTREQFAIMALRLMAYMEGIDYQAFINGYLSAAKTWVAKQGFADTAGVSDWAQDAMNVALFLGVFSGSKLNGRLYIQPKINITREQAAVVINSSIIN